MFYHSLISDWNHGNAHFLRGIARELQHRGHIVDIYEPRDSWSVQNLTAEHGLAPIAGFHATYPDLRSTRYELATLALDAVLGAADIVLVHEWNDHALVSRIGAHHAEHPHYRLLFHDTHHRSVSDREAMAAYDLASYDGVLAFGQVIRDRYLHEGWTARAWTWHEAADVTVFRPVGDGSHAGDLVWIGNWAGEERSAELREFLLDPVRALRIRARVYGVRYPDDAKRALADAGIAYGGWLPNYEVPQVFRRFALTVHVPRRPYARDLPGIPTIRPFEAMACGIPLICAPWDDVEGLFRAGEDYLVARSGEEMRELIAFLLARPEAAAAMAARARSAILARHTCAHRVDELLEICEALSGGQRSMGVPA
jgi:spore maturation protein CgeB